MAELVCKHGGSGSFVRNGMAHGHQRYRCKACGRSFTATPARGKPAAMKALAVLLYALGNVSQGMIARLLGGEPCGGLQVGPRGRGGGARTLGHAIEPASCRSTRCGPSWMAKKQGLALAGL